MTLVHVHTLLGIETLVPDDPDLKFKRRYTTDCYFVVSGFIDLTVT